MPRPSRAARCAALLSLFMALLTGSLAHGQTSSETIAGIEAGFEGAYRVGKWTPVWVELQAGSSAIEGHVEVTAADGDGVPATYAALDGSIRVPAGQTARQLVYVKFGRTPAWLMVRVMSGGRTLAQRPFSAGSFPSPQPLAREVVLTLGGDIGVAQAVELSRRRGGNAYLPCGQDDVSLLPDRWFGYDSVDTVVLVMNNPRFLAAWSDSQVEALAQWVTQGGRLVVSSSGEPVAERWAAFYPGKLAEMQVLRRGSPLEMYASASQAIQPRAGGRLELPVAVLADYEGTELLTEQVAGQSQPLLLLTPRGFGMIMFAAVDLTAPPLAAWRDRPRLVLRLLRMGDESDPTAGDYQRSGGQMSHIGYDDLSGQLRAALEAFSFGGMPLVPFSWVAGLIVLYIVLIGPVDYYFLRRVVGRMEYTWLTFPLLAAAMALAAVALSAVFKGDSLSVRQLNIVDYDLATGARREVLWAHVYSPANDRYDVTLNKGQSLLSWHGLPGSALGGMHNPAPAMKEESRYRITDDPAGGLKVHPHKAPINVWSTKSFAGYHWSRADAAERMAALRQAKLRETYDHRLSGSFANATEFELTDCQLLHDRWSYSIGGTIAPGDVIDLADEGEPRDLEWKMTRRIVSEDNRAVSTPWNPNQLDVPRIAEMMMFHRAAGGTAYTALGHRQLQFLDLSRHLHSGRAVLVGRTKSPPAVLHLDGEPLAPADGADWSYVRMVIPVEPPLPR